MKVEQLMQKEVVTVAPDASLKEVAAALVEHRISGVPVCDEEGRVLGVVSEGDILYKERGRIERPGGALAWLVDGAPYADVTKSWAKTAGESMTAPAITITPGRAAAEAARLMIEKGVNRLVVVDRDDRLVGIVTRADLVRAFPRSDIEIVEEIQHDVLRRVLWVEPETIKIIVRQGEVELAGELETNADAGVLVSLVEKIPGVVSVRSSVTHRFDATRSGRFERTR
ncbi:MAG: CBS domain-containing protein [Gaiellaceae bacterium]